MIRPTFLKRLLLIFASFIIGCVMLGCGAYTPPSTPSKGEGNNGASGGDKLFSVDLVLGGHPFSPPVEMHAKWTGEGGVYSAKFDESGHAEIDGLDGDYHVTLSVVPDGYTYDPNGYLVNNNHKSIEVEMLEIIPTTGKGDGLYNAIVLSKLGTYRTTLNSRGHVVYYEYEPQAEGKYSIESWVDVTENEINPIIDVYNGTKAYKVLNHVQNDGGFSSTYTKNFRMELELSRDMIGNVWTFGLYVDCRSGVYPVTVDFTIKYEGEYVLGEDKYEHMVPHGPFWNGTAPSGSARDVYLDTDNVLDGTRVKLNWQDNNGNGVFDSGDGGDGYYHLYDAKSDTLGPILFTYINKDFRILQTDSGMAFLDVLVRLRFEGRDYYSFIDEYSAHCNSDGGHPVTADLKDFLFNYSLNQRLFFDGDGWAEDPKVAGLKSSEENQWLFSCYYYA